MTYTYNLNCGYVISLMNFSVKNNIYIYEVEWHSYCSPKNIHTIILKKEMFYSQDLAQKKEERKENPMKWSTRKNILNTWISNHLK